MSQEFPHVLDPAVIEEFDAKGFVVTDGLFSAAELATYARAVDAEIARRTAHDDRSVDDKSTYEQSFIQCMRLWETSRAVAPLSFHAGLAGVAVQLLGVDGVRMWQDQALYKEPGGRVTTPHQDQPFWPIGTAPLVSAWIAFDDVTLANGALSYVPGSHKVGKLKVVDITHSTDPYDILSDPALNGAAPELVEVPAGAVVWHHGFTVHQAAPNTTDKNRRAFTVVYIDDKARRDREWPVFPLDRAGVGVGEIIAGEGLPQLWPPLEEIPEPPALISQPTGPQHLER